jgi:hypothetical protein
MTNVTAMARRTLLATVVIGTLAVSACTRPEDETSAGSSIAPVTDTLDVSDSGDSGDSGDEATDTEATDDSADTTTAPSTTSAPAPTTTIDSGASTETTATKSPPTTTTPPDDPSDLILIFDGILPFRFGDRDVDIVPALTELLGAPTQDELREYPDADQGAFFDPTGEESFVARFGRAVCYPNSLCVQFGAGAPETLIFTGWRIDATSQLTTDDGMAIGSTLAEFTDVITFDPAVSCFQVVDGSAAGIDVTLLSDDGDFATPAPDGEGLELGDPDPAKVTVVEMRAGQLPVSVFADC